MKTIEIDDLELESGERILDVGCGEGRHLRAALEDVDLVGVGVDRSLYRLKEAFRKFWLYPLQGCGNLVCSDIYQLPFRTSSFRAVICSEVLEHLEDYETALREMIRVLEPGGLLAISVPKFLAEKGCWLMEPEYPKEVIHLRIFREETLIEQVESMGLTCEATRGVHAFHTPFWWLMCLLGELLPLAENPEPFEHEVGTRDWWWEWLRGGEDYPSRVVAAYYAFLTWHETHQWPIIRRLEELFNPFLGRSQVFYFRKRAS